MKRLTLQPVQLTMACLLISGMLASCLQEPPTEKPNVLFIAVDDLRPELNCYGKSQIHSPHIDKLADEGLLFERAYCNIPVCGASRSSLMTGLRPTKNRFLTYYTRMDEDAPGTTTLPRHFRNHGYHTISNGKIYHHQDDATDSWDELWYPDLPSTWRDYQTEANLALEMDGEGQGGAAWEKITAHDSIYFDGKIARKSIRDLERLKHLDKPFFLAAGFLKPHLPFNATSPYWDVYDPAEIRLPGHDTLPGGLEGINITNWGELRAYDGMPDSEPVSDEVARQLIHGYYACVSSTDAQIGKLLFALKALDLERNTIVILWGDHGWNLREHGLWCKHCNFNTSLQTAMMIKVPGKTNGRRTSALVEFVDIYPTLSELCGLPLPDHLEGKSMVPLIEDPGSTIKDFIIGKWNNGLTIKTDRYAYTEWTNDADEVSGTMLYDHKTDPDELYNLSPDPDYQALSDSLSVLMNANKGRDYYEPVTNR